MTSLTSLVIISVYISTHDQTDNSALSVEDLENTTQAHWPDSIKLTGSGGITKLFPQMMKGEYKKRWMMSNVPIYHHDTKDWFLFFEKFSTANVGVWVMGPDTKSAWFFISNILKSPPTYIPHHGWRYFENGTLRTDPNFSVLYSV